MRVNQRPKRPIDRVHIRDATLKSIAWKVGAEMSGYERDRADICERGDPEQVVQEIDVCLAAHQEVIDAIRALRGKWGE